MSWWCRRERKGGWILGVIVQVLRIPEETSQEPTGEETKYVFVLTAKPQRISDLLHNRTCEHPLCW